MGRPSKYSNTGASSLCCSTPTATRTAVGDTRYQATQTILDLDTRKAADTVASTGTCLKCVTFDIPLAHRMLTTVLQELLRKLRGDPIILEAPQDRVLLTCLDDGKHGY